MAVDLSTTYMGLKLSSPIIAGSNGLMNNVSFLKQLEDAGVGAVVLKSIFEEQIKHEAAELLKSSDSSYSYREADSYIESHDKTDSLEQYLKLIAEAKKALKVPVIASIHCVSQYDWGFFTKKIQEAGADAIELNVYVLPTDINRSGAENEQVYFDVVEHVKQYVTIPFSLKIGYYFSNVLQTITKLSETGLAGLVLFSRPYQPDIDIHELQVAEREVYTTYDDYLHTLRWVAILSDKVQCDICASTGIHSYESVVKQLLAGASAVQVASVLYKLGAEAVEGLLSGLKTWMNIHGFQSIDQFKGMCSQKNVPNPAAFERVQFMKVYSKIE